MERTVTLCRVDSQTSQLWQTLSEKKTDSFNYVNVDFLLDNFIKTLDKLGTRIFFSFEKENEISKKLSALTGNRNEIIAFAHEISLLKKIFTDQAIEHIYYIDSIFPLHDIHQAKKLFEIHREYSADYSFGENLPPGISGVFFSRGLFEAMEIEQNEQNENLQIDTGIPDTLPVSLKSYIEKNINHFHVEIHFEHPDLRMLRLDYSSKTHRSLVDTEKVLKTLGSRESYYTELEKLFTDTPGHLFNFPSYLELEINGSCEYSCTFCARNSDAVILDQALSLGEIKNILDFSKNGLSDTVIALGGMGEPLEHSGIVDILEMLLGCEFIPMVVIETNGKNLDKISRFVKHHGFDKLRIIINLNSLQHYEIIHGTTRENKDKVITNIDFFCKELDNLNPLLKKNIYIQTLKIVENERELDEIYDFTDQRGISFLLQKYNSYVGMMPEKRVSDMTPLDRSFCWHLRRDMYIRANGDVVFCKQDIKNSKVRGNLRDTSLAEIWSSQKTDWVSNYNRSFPQIPDCQTCDEYYTFNM